MPTTAPSADTTTGAGTTAPFTGLIRQANRAWRAAGVRSDDRVLLQRELTEELTAVRHDGRESTDVVGDDPTRTFRQWAIERDLAGRSLRLGLLGALTLGSIALGAAVLITAAIVTFTTPGAPFITHGAIWLAALISGTAVSWLLAPLACWAALAHGGDPRAGSTARWLFALLPVGAIVGFALSVIAGVISGYSSAALPIIAVVIPASFTATAAAARTLAIRYTRTETTSNEKTSTI